LSLFNGKVFKIKDMTPGINAPPMHPWCRSTTVPQMGNWRDKFFTERKGKYQIEDKQSLVRKAGALNDINDPYHSKRDKHAMKYYKSVLNRNKKEKLK